MLGLWRLGCWSSPRRARETGEDGSDARSVDGAVEQSETKADYSSSYGSYEPSSSSECGSPAADKDTGPAISTAAPHAAAEAARGDVVLKMEAETASETRMIIRLLRISLVVAAAMLIIQLVLTLKKDHSAWFASREFAVLDLSFASYCLAVMLVVLSLFCRRVWRVRHRRWSKRRIRLSSCYFFLLLCQIVNVTMWMTSSASVWHSACGLYSSVINTSGFLQWTCFNTIFCGLAIMAHCCCPWPQRQAAGKAPAATDTIGGQGRTYLDAPFYHFWPEFVIWGALQADLIWMRITISRGSDNAPSPGDCEAVMYICYHEMDVSWDIRTQTALITSILGFYTSAVIVFSCRTFRAYKAAPYSEYRVGNMFARLQLRLTILAMLFVNFGVTCLWFIGTERCSSYLQTWIGLLPIQVAMTTLVSALAIFMMPRSADDMQLLVVDLLQGIAWTEADRCVRLAERRAAEEAHPGVGDLAQEAVFCFETALKALYFSVLTYRYEEARGADEAAAGAGDPNTLEGHAGVTMRLDYAMQLFDLEAIDIMREATHDTKAIFAHGPDTIVIAFRGTASRSGILADLQVWRTRHPLQHPESGLRAASVHTGFLRAWTAGGFRESMLGRVRGLLRKAGAGAQPRVLVTGHSLGGALATPAAYDIQHEFGLQRVDCYTMGAPRVGNAVFVSDYNRHVTETWHIVNDQDTITRTGKFYNAYRRTGQRVIWNELGSIIVRPMPLEQRMQLNLLGGSVNQHFLAGYIRSAVAVLRAQFSSKGMAGGAAGVRQMVEGSATLCKILHSGGFDMDEAVREGSVTPQVCRGCSRRKAAMPEGSQKKRNGQKKHNSIDQEETPQQAEELV